MAVIQRAAIHRTWAEPSHQVKANLVSRGAARLSGPVTVAEQRCCRCLDIDNVGEIRPGRDNAPHRIASIASHVRLIPKPSAC